MIFPRTTVRNFAESWSSREGCNADDRLQETVVFDRYHIVSEGDIRDAKKRLDSRPGTILGTKKENTLEG
jgi:hypothetical protein